MGVLVICVLAWLVASLLAACLVAAAARAGHDEDVVRGYMQD